MRIINLIENTEGVKGCATAHGLSFYIETSSHRMLLDLGPSEETLNNAELLGIDLENVDTVILSHGHYDHSGGIIPFSKKNDKALIYMQRSAEGEYYADDGNRTTGHIYRYMGIDSEIHKLPQVRFMDGDFVIDDGIEVFTIKDRNHEILFTNKRLLIRNGDTYIRDEFKHEHFLVINEGGSSVLLSGCAHSGILNIVEAYVDKYGQAPDVAISGFHLMAKRDYREAEINDIKAMARELKKYPTRYFTCHCTGEAAYAVMKDIMGDQLQYVHFGEEVVIGSWHAAESARKMS